MTYTMPLAAKITKDNPQAYQALVVEGGTPASAMEQLRGVGPEQLLVSPVSSPVVAYAMLAGLWLWLDGLNECHEIVQKSPENLLASTLNVRSKPLELHQNGQSARSVGNGASINQEHLREMESTLAFWHAIMHRREGDFSNSKYWLARAGKHPVLDRLAGQAPALIHNQPADKSLLKVCMTGWNASAFVDLVEAVHDQPQDSRHAIAVALQRLEWRVLFEWCMRG